MSKDKIFENLKNYLKSKGIMFSEGAEVLQLPGRPLYKYVSVITGSYPKVYENDEFTLGLIEQLQTLQAENERKTKALEEIKTSLKEQREFHLKNYEKDNSSIEFNQAVGLKIALVIVDEIASKALGGK